MKIFPVNRFNSNNVICEKKNNSDYNYRMPQLNNYYPNNNISFGCFIYSIIIKYNFNLYKNEKIFINNI